MLPHARRHMSSYYFTTTTKGSRVLCGGYVIATTIGREVARNARGDGILIKALGYSVISVRLSRTGNLCIALQLQPWPGSSPSRVRSKWILPKPAGPDRSWRCASYYDISLSLESPMYDVVRRFSEPAGWFDFCWRASSAAERCAMLSS